MRNINKNPFHSDNKIKIQAWEAGDILVQKIFVNISAAKS
jgi:hypothetical protein